MRNSGGLTTVIPFLVLVCSLTCLTGALLLSLRDAQNLFDNAAHAQSQTAIVSRIQALAATTPIDTGTLRQMLTRYRQSIEEESKALGPVSSSQQSIELADSDRLTSLVQDAGSDRSATISSLVTSIAAREQREADALAGQMKSLRRRVSWLAVLLTGFALIAAGFGAARLIAANRRLTEEVAARTADIAAIDHSRRLFFAKVSHELKSPVTVMRGEAEVALAQGAGPDALREALGHVVASAEFLDHRIGELLGLSQADDGKLKLAFAAIDLRAVVDTAVAGAKSYANSLGVTIEVDRSCAVTVNADSRWLAQVFIAIIDNAVKFSPADGSVQIAIARRNAGALISITDRGAGLALPELPRIFDAYYQTEAGSQRGGTGLGLALARWVVEQHGGSVAARNAATGGCVVEIFLPVIA